MEQKNNTLLFYTLLYFVFLYLPVLFLPLFSFNDSNFMSFPLSGFTTEHYEEMWKSTNLHKALWASVKVGVVASVVSTTIALFAAKAFARYKFRGENISYGAIMMPFLIPEIILAVSILVIWLSLGFKLGLVPVTLGHILFCTPFAMLILIARIEGFDFSLEEASRDLGENAWGTFYRVSLPLYLPGIIPSLLLSFIISFDEFILAFFLTGSDATLPMYMWGQMRFIQKLPHVLALGAVIIVFTTLIVLLAFWLRNIGQGKDKAGLGIKIHEQFFYTDKSDI
jgi:spermidine/putrescine transport system permease protein